MGLWLTGKNLTYVHLGPELHGVCLTLLFSSQNSVLSTPPTYGLAYQKAKAASLSNESNT